MPNPTVEASKVEPQASQVPPVMPNPTVESCKVEPQASEVPVMPNPTVEPRKVEPQASDVSANPPVMPNPVEPRKVEPQASDVSANPPVMPNPVEPRKVEPQASDVSANPPVMPNPVEPRKVESQASDHEVPANPPVMPNPTVLVEPRKQQDVDAAAAICTPREKPPVPRFAPCVYLGSSSVEQYLDQAYGDSHRSPDRSRFFADPASPKLKLKGGPEDSTTQLEQQATPMQVDTPTPVKQQEAKIEQQLSPMQVDAPTPVKQQNPEAKIEQQPVPLQLDARTPVKQQNPEAKIEQQRVDAATPAKQQNDVLDAKAVTDDAGGKPYNKEGDEDAWRKDRRGQWLSPHALYMRFYRSTRGH